MKNNTQFFKFGLLCNQVAFGDYSKIFYECIKSYKIHAEYQKLTVANNNLIVLLSKMYTTDIMGCSVSPTLQETIIPLLDILDASAQKAKKVDTVKNKNGVIIGYFLGEKHKKTLIHKQIQLWLEEEI